MDMNEEAGTRGLRAARGIGILTYRNYAIMKEKQSDPDPNKLDHYRASSYISYQGNKLSRRFNAYSYWLLTKAMVSTLQALIRQRGRRAPLAHKGVTPLHTPRVFLSTLIPVQDHAAGPSVSDPDV